MKQVDFIQLLSSKLPNIFKTEELLLVLLESSPPNLALHEVRKNMHNHLSRLEQQNLIERLCPKRTRNASFKCLFSFVSKDANQFDIDSEQTLDIEKQNGFDILNKHVNQLKKDTETLNKKRQLFSQFTESYKMYKPVIEQKLTEIDSTLIDKKIELEAIQEIISAVKLPSSRQY